MLEGRVVKSRRINMGTGKMCTEYLHTVGQGHHHNLNFYYTFLLARVRETCRDERNPEARVVDYFSEFASCMCMWGY